MQIVKIKLADLVLDPMNARKHNEKNIHAIVGSLKKFGQQKPIVINSKNVIVAGNGTYEAAKLCGWSEIAVVVTDLDSFNEAAFAIADNRTAELAEWNMDILGDTLQSLRENDLDLSLIGFDIGDLEQYMPKPPSEGSKELSADDFSQFDNTCPKCGFEFDNK